MTHPEIEAFLLAAKTGTITAAAEQLYVTQPALSRRIRSLEAELGYSLLKRGRGVWAAELTELYACCRWWAPFSFCTLVMAAPMITATTSPSASPLFTPRRMRSYRFAPRFCPA